MKFLFDDQAFKFETLRAAGFAVDNGADLSEVLLTAAAIPEGDEEAWMREWKATADRIHERAKYSFEHGDKISARGLNVLAGRRFGLIPCHNAQATKDRMRNNVSKPLDRACAGLVLSE
jgi:hypothetical protein